MEEKPNIIVNNNHNKINGNSNFSKFNNEALSNEKNGRDNLISGNRKEERTLLDRNKIISSKPVNENSMSYRFSEEEKKEIIDKEESRKLRESVLRKNRPLNSTLSSQNQTVEDAKEYLKAHRDAFEDINSSRGIHSPSPFDQSSTYSKTTKPYRTFDKSDIVSRNIYSPTNKYTTYNINNIPSSSCSSIISSTDNERWSNNSLHNSSTDSSSTTTSHPKINNIIYTKKYNPEDYINNTSYKNNNNNSNYQDNIYSIINKKDNNIIKTILNDGTKKINNNEGKSNKKVEFNLTPNTKMYNNNNEGRRLQRVTVSPTKYLQQESNNNYSNININNILKKESSYVVGICSKCSVNLYNTDSITYAMEKTYHENCFRCITCRQPLKGKKFYHFNGKIYCEKDYILHGIIENTERCYECGNNIVDVVLTALGKTYHPQCFRCKECRKMLDGTPFTVGKNGYIYCSEDYHKLYSPKCSRCGLSIFSDNEITEIIRVQALKKDFHVNCYTCEGCGVNLKNTSDGKCYPLDDILLCKSCNILWNKTGGGKTPITDL
uniref:LIM domain-containing protein n=1 Tax=Strongyloides papillosus TaxID=174720 RepID=A0A0N5BHZ1_STREA